MAKIDSYRRFFFGTGAFALLASAAFALYWQMRGPATDGKADLSQPPQENAPQVVQLEAPTEEVNIDGAPNFAEGDESGWVVSGDTDSIPLLIRYLQSQDELTQLAALAEFAGMGAKAIQAVPAIVDALQDPKSLIRLQAAVTLIQMNVQAKAAVSALAKELQSGEAESRERAAGAVDRLVNPPGYLGTSCWGPALPPRVARPWVSKAVEQAMR